MLRIWSSLLLACGAVLFGACSEQIEQAEVVRPVKTLVLDASGRSGSRVFPGTVQAAKRAKLEGKVDRAFKRMESFAPEASVSSPGPRHVNRGERIRSRISLPVQAFG